MHSNITTTHLLQDTGCVAIPFVDVHPQTIAATLAVRSIPEGVTQAVVVILLPFPDRFVHVGKLPLTLDSCLCGND